MDGCKWRQQTRGARFFLNNSVKPQSNTQKITFFSSPPSNLCQLTHPFQPRAHALIHCRPQPWKRNSSFFTEYIRNQRTAGPTLIKLTNGARNQHTPCARNTRLSSLWYDSIQCYSFANTRRASLKHRHISLGHRNQEPLQKGHWCIEQELVGNHVRSTHGI